MQLSPATCDVLPAGTLSVEQAQARIAAAIQPLQARERVDLRSALGRILATEVIARFSVPPYRNSSMDGYAFAHASLQNSHTLTQVGISWAGRPFQGQVREGECVRIMTGAMLPTGTDSVEMQENTRRDDAHITLLQDTAYHANVRHPGEDLQAGEPVLAAGRQLNAADLGLLASLGISEVDVLRRPRVAFFSTGDELKAIGDSLQPGEIYDSNRYTLYGMLRRLEIDMLDMGVIPDQPSAVEQAFRDASQWADVLISSGGVSVGDADYVTATLQRMGQISFWKMAMKPGKPLAHGRIGDCLFFGLPGNPVSVMATFLLFVRPAILKLRGEVVPTLPTYTAISSVRLQKAVGRKEYQRGVCQQNQQGQWEVSSTGKQESHMLRSMSQANCFIVLERETADLPAGSAVHIIPFTGLL